MERILKLKHWQLFLLIFAIPFVVQLIMLVLFISSVIAHPDSPHPALPGSLRYVIMLPMLAMLLHLAWSWAVGVTLNRRIPAEFRPKNGLFKACVIVPALYGVSAMCFFAFVLFPALTHMHYGPPVDPSYAYLLILVVPLHLFSIFSIFYNIYFVAKTIKTLELRRETTFMKDFGLEFVLVWFLFVGLWFLQPRLNKLVNEPGRTPAQDELS